MFLRCTFSCVLTSRQAHLRRDCRTDPRDAALQVPREARLWRVESRPEKAAFFWFLVNVLFVSSKATALNMTCNDFYIALSRSTDRAIKWSILFVSISDLSTLPLRNSSWLLYHIKKGARNNSSFITLCTHRLEANGPKATSGSRRRHPIRFTLQCK